MVCRLPIGKHRKFKTMTSPHPSQMSLHLQFPWESLSALPLHRTGSFSKVPLRGEASRASRGSGEELYSWGCSSQIAGHTASVSIPNLANGTAVLTGCKLKSITCQVHVIELLLAFKMLCNLITLTSFLFFLLFSPKQN